MMTITAQVFAAALSTASAAAAHTEGSVVLLLVSFLARAHVSSSGVRL
jgi:hypothetical protein